MVTPVEWIMQLPAMVSYSRVSISEFMQHGAIFINLERIF